MRVVTAEQMREADRLAIEEIGMKEELLMENAGRAAAAKIIELYPALQYAAVLAGKGNNGGDGYVIARTLESEGIRTDVYFVSSDGLKGAALYHQTLYEKSGFTPRQFDPSSFQADTYDVIIDAMLGTGIQGEVKPPFDKAVQVLGKTDTPVVAVDIPSGVPSGEEDVPSSAVKADATVILESPKLSAYLFPAKEYYGQTHTVSIGMPNAVWDKAGNEAMEWGMTETSASFPVRKENAHKGRHGRGLLIGGSKNMAGAPAIAALAALESGAGLLTTALPESLMYTTAPLVPETTFLRLPEKEGELAEDSVRADFGFDRYDAVAVGPGLGRLKEAKEIVRRALVETTGILILDADALYWLPELDQELSERTAPLVLTPHPGEMAHLGGTTPGEVNKRRFSLAGQYTRKTGCYLVLKGANTICTTPEGDQAVHTSGNAGLAKGGSGDTLTGILLGQVMQGEDTAAMVNNAVFLHGHAADLAVEQEETDYSLRASKLASYVPRAIKNVQLFQENRRR